MLTPKSRKCLEEFGWSDDRNVDIKLYRMALKEEGYPVHESVEACLRSYAGIQIWTSGDADANDIRIDPIKAIESVYIERVQEEYDFKAGKKLCVIGMYHRGHMVVMMDDEGVVYGGYDEEFHRLGDSMEDCLNSICV